MASTAAKDDTTPLLTFSDHAFVYRASAFRTFGNIIVSIVGTGVLGLPYTFRISGWAAGTIAVCLSAALTYYCMLLLVKCRYKLESRGYERILTYGDLGKQVYGCSGQALVDIMVLISQSGCCVAYLIFIGQNLSSIFTGDTKNQAQYIAILLPLEIALAWVRSMAGLAPSSIVADICNVLAMAIVIKDDFGSFQGFEGTVAFKKWTSVPFALGIAVYCYEGFGMTLSLEGSMKKPHLFPTVLAAALFPITILYIGFGIIGYFAFCDETQDIITLNLPNDWSTVAVKLGLCVALLFTFPVMLYPVHEMSETKLMGNACFQRTFANRPKLCRLVLDSIRGITVVIIAVIALLIPTFGVFVSLVGSTVCSMLAFVFPGFFHLCTFKGCNPLWRQIIDICLIVGGICFAIYGTYTTIVDVSISA